VEKVLDKRRHNREDQIFVKFKGYGDEHNRRIPASAINWK